MHSGRFVSYSGRYGDDEDDRHPHRDPRSPLGRDPRAQGARDRERQDDRAADRRARGPRRDAHRRRRQRLHRLHRRRRLPQRRPRAPARRRGGRRSSSRASPTPTSRSSPTRSTSSSPSGCSSARRSRGPAKAAFFNAGTEAVENAVKFARLYTKRPAVIAFEGAFHGRTLLSMTLTSKPHPYKAGMGPFAPEVYRAPFPQDYRGPDARTALAELAAALRHAGRGRAGRGDRRRAGPGRGRLPRRAGQEFMDRAALDLRRARDLPDRRRGADRLRAHRQAVRDRALRRRARPDHGRQVDRRRPAALGRARQGGDHGRRRTTAPSAARTSATPSRRPRRSPSST